MAVQPEVTEVRSESESESLAMAALQQPEAALPRRRHEELAPEIRL